MFFIKANRHLLELSTLTLIFFPLSLGASALPFGGGGRGVCFGINTERPLNQRLRTKSEEMVLILWKG